MRRVYFKHPSDPPILLTADHFRPEVSRIILTAGQEYPPQAPIVITRGAEDVPNGHPKSLHLTSQAFDLRTRHLLSSVDRGPLLDRILGRLGPGYSGYCGQRDGVEWFHIQWEGAC